MSYFDSCKGPRSVGGRGVSRWDYEANSGMNGINPCYSDRGGHETRDLGIELDLQLEKLANLQTERVIATRNRPCGRFGRAGFSHNGLDDQIFYDVEAIGTSKEEYEAVRDEKIAQAELESKRACVVARRLDMIDATAQVDAHILKSSKERQEREAKGVFGAEDAVAARVAASTLDFLVANVELCRKNSQLHDALLEEALVAYNKSKRALRSVRDNISRERDRVAYEAQRRKWQLEEEEKRQAEGRDAKPLSAEDPQ